MLLAEDAADLAALEAFCVDNPDLEALEHQLAEFNVFEAAGLIRQEVKHSRFLGFLLDPRNPHGLGTVVLLKVLQSVVRNNVRDGHVVTQLELELMDLSDSVVSFELERVDVKVESLANKLTVIVENKIDSKQHSNQLERYLENEKRCRPDWRILPVVLSKYGDETDEAEKYYALSYGVVADIVTNLQAAHASVLAPDVAMALRHYERLLRRNIVSNASLDELCERIVAKHRRAIVKLAEYLGDPQNQAESYAREVLVRDHGFICDRNEKLGREKLLAPREWNDWMPEGSTRLWLVCAWVKEERKGLRLRLEIGPVRLDKPYDSEYRKRFVQAIQRHGSPFAMTGTPKDAFTRIYLKQLHTVRFGESDDIDSWEAEVRNNIARFVTTELPDISKALESIVHELGM